MKHKNLFGKAFVVGFGLAVGNYVGEMVNSALNGVVLGIGDLAAKKGNKIAQQVMNKVNVQYEKESEPNKVVGFHP